jgi:hypothetical protein
LEIERERYYRVTVRYQKKKLLNDVLASLKGTMLENNATFMVERVSVRVSEKGLQEERALHRAQSTAQPFTRGSVIVFLLWVEGGGREDTVVDVGEGPDGGIRSRSSGKGTELIAWGWMLSHSAHQRKRETYG